MGFSVYSASDRGGQVIENRLQKNY